MLKQSRVSILHSVSLERVLSSFKGTNDNNSKLKEVKFRLDARKKFFTSRILRHWNRLPREIQDAIGSVKGQIGWGFDQSDLLKDGLSTAGDWTRPRPSCGFLSSHCDI